MILFLNFAPYEFMGGAEKWILETAKRARKQEESFVVSVASQIANIYGQIVLKRKFEKRTKEKITNSISLSFSSFIPFSDSWGNARKYFRNARILYIKYEVLELFILLYYVGFSGLKKTIAGMHTPFLYPSPQRFFDRVHNSFYGSFLNIYILSLLKKVHVLNKKDYAILNKKMRLKNVVYVPNSVATTPTNIATLSKNEATLDILFIGELSERKGVDILIELIKNAPQKYLFTIAGDGPMKAEIKDLLKRRENCIYKGFIDKKEVEALYRENDILFLPSRAESMSLAVLEALSYGLIIIDSKEITLDLGKHIEYSCDNNPEAYLSVLQKLYREKQTKKFDRQITKNYFQKNFSSAVVYPKLLKQVFEVI